MLRSNGAYTANDIQLNNQSGNRHVLHVLADLAGGDNDFFQFKGRGQRRGLHGHTDNGRNDGG
ncbi:hypothetical protein [Endozoicomonas ascidiicola]|uniref:hypothetical protein n=1 Tax=Endozoicomonas ascidiicola TaxID=1698521 RepID=UPI003CCBB7AC